MSADTAPLAERGADDGSSGFLGRIERIGNKIPPPGIIFLDLILIVILLSAILSAAGVQAQMQVAEPKSPEVVPDFSDAGSSYPSYDHPVASTVPDDTVRMIVIL